MSNEVVIKIDGLSKLYRLGELHKQTGSFREKVTHCWTDQSNRTNQTRLTNPTNKTSPTNKTNLTS